jgi:hypothetical protein
MNCINNPTLLASQNPVFMDGIMATPTNRRKVFVAAKPLSNPPRFMVDVLTLGFLAPLAYRVESQIGLFNLCILLVFTLAFGGCIPQPSAALEALRSFEGSF